MVNKIIHYHDKESMGSWRNYAAFIADDGDDSDGNIHMQQSDNLCNIIDDNYNNYNFDKLYLDIFKRLTPNSLTFFNKQPDTRTTGAKIISKNW